MKIQFLFVASLLTTFAIASSPLLTASPAFAASEPRVFFVEPKNNADVKPTFQVKFGQKGLVVSPAGKELENKKAGHFHILVDEKFFPAGEVIPADATHLHYGKAQMETTVTLTPGTHMLTLQFADGAHRSLGEKLSQTITVHVK